VTRQRFNMTKITVSVTEATYGGKHAARGE